uniref:Conserved oligomeric Golgi complex subunit 4 n=2 Tax=Acrobeloides nanus TaxID=290746 RepID=A0A914DWB9_9BILA
MLSEPTFNDIKRPLVWEPTNHIPSNQKSKNEDEEDFSDLLTDLRSELQTARDAEERILKDIQNELGRTGAAIGDKDVMHTFDLALSRLNNQIECVEIDSRQLANNLRVVSGLAEKISSKVSALDVAKSRVVECLQRVSDLRDLRTCAEGVEIAMQHENYEEAAKHIHRFLALDSAVFKMGEQIDAKDAGHSMKYSYEILRQAAGNLIGIIEKKFDTAVLSNDTASMERYFKLFPLINEHTSGLQRFGKYLCTKIEKLGDDNYKIMEAGGTDDNRKNLLYSDSLFNIFEGIARIIELHQPLIDNYYGPDKLLDLIGILQAECDRQAIRVINAFIQKRQFEHRAKLVDNYLRKSSSIEKIDPRELDSLLTEVTMMHTRAELYWRFLKRRLGEAPARPLSESDSKDGFEVGKSAEEVFEDEFTEEERRQLNEKLKKQKAERNNKLDLLLNRSALGTKMQELLGKYVLTEQYYMTESVKKAIEMDDVEEGATTSSLLDDVFFIVRKSIERSISSSNVDCVCAMLNNGITLLETDFIKYLQGSIKAGYPSVSWTAEAYQTAQTAYNVLQHGKTVAEAGPETQRRTYLIALNNLRAAISCVGTLKSGLKNVFAKHLTQISNVEQGKLEQSTNQFDDLCRRLGSLAHAAVLKLCDAAFRPKLKTNADAYFDLPHSITEEDFAEFEAVDPFIENFISQLDKHIAQFEQSLVPENYQDLLRAVSIEVVAQLERVIFKCTFNRMGALQLDKEFRQLTSYLTTVAGWSFREKCARVSQIVTLLNAENIQEATEFYQQTSREGNSLSLNDMKKVLFLRNDLPRDKIKLIKA